MFHTGRARLNRKRLERGAARESCWMPILCFLLVHPERGPILIDTGVSAGLMKWQRSFLGRTLTSAFRLNLEGAVPCADRLRACGFKARDIELGVLTHLHYDHTGGLAGFPNTTFMVSDRELQFACSLGRIDALRQGFFQSDFARSSQVKPFDWTAASSMEPFDSAYDLLDDGSVMLFPTPGHTPGHLSVLVRAAGGREFLIAGDAAFTEAQITRGIGLGTYPRLFAGDLTDALTSLERLRVFVARRENLEVLTSHDPELGDDVAPGPMDVLAS